MGSTTLRRVLGAALILAGAACDDGAGPSGPAGRYSLVRLGGVTLPMQMTSTQPAPGITCVDTMHAVVLTLRAGGSSTRNTTMRKSCTGQAPQTEEISVSGSWSARGDSIDVTFPIETPTGGSQFTQHGRLEGRDLVFRQRIYTEADPNGESGQTYDIVYRREG